jgi:hypothetical protein
MLPDITTKASAAIENLHLFSKAAQHPHDVGHSKITL